jgi:outer membrane lipoprotein-sorting protein
MNAITILAPAALLLLPPSASHTAASKRAEDILARSRAMYASLKSYADTGTVDAEYGSSSRDRHTFKTWYRAPRLFLFDFTKQANAERLVVWSDDQAFHSWTQSTGVQYDYPKGQGSTAFTLGSYPTRGSITMIPSFLFSGAGLVGTLTEFGDASDEGTESVDGRPCHKLVGVAKSVYTATGHVVNVRRTTVWIDVETLLVRKVFEDTPRGVPAGQVNRTTTTFKPHANSTIDDVRFRFTPPSSQNGQS